MKAALTGLVRSARHELLSFDDPAGALGHGIPEPFLEFAGACVRTAAAQTATVTADRAPARADPSRGTLALPRRGPGD